MLQHIRKNAGYACAPISGLLLAWCFPTFQFFPLAWVALVPLFIAAARARSHWAAAAHFLVGGWVFYSLLLQWLMSNIFWAGGWAVIGYQLLCLVLALCWGLLGFLWHWAHKRTPLMGALGLAVLWVAMEHAQANLFSGFGWGSLGYSQGPDLALAQCAALGGVSFVSFALVLCNALLALAWAVRSARWLRTVTAVAVIVAFHVAGNALIAPANYDSQPFVAGIFQSNYPQEMKWDREYLVDMVKKAAEYSHALFEAERVDAFFWPEALVMENFEKPELLGPVADLTKKTGVPVFMGAVREVKGANYNSSALITPDGTVAGYYDKVHLAPFGEYMPFTSIFPFLRHITPMDVDSGHEQKVLQMGERRLGPLICFEVLFASLVENLRRQGADMLTVVTNLGWFGMSNAVPQEFELARFRAIESRLPLVQASNTGISGVFDPWGRFTGGYGVVYDGKHYALDQSKYQPQDFMMQRCVGTVPVPRPGKRPIPGGPVLFPWLAIATTALLFAAAGFRLQPSRTAEIVEGEVTPLSKRPKR